MQEQVPLVESGETWGVNVGPCLSLEQRVCGLHAFQRVCKLLDL